MRKAIQVGLSVLALATGLLALDAVQNPASAQARCPRGYDGSCGYCVRNLQGEVPACGGYYRRRSYERDYVRPRYSDERPRSERQYERRYYGGGLECRPGTVCMAR